MWNQATNITALTYFSFFKAASQSTLSDNGNVLGLCNVLHMQPLPGKTWWRKHSTNDLLKNKAINCPKKLETHNQWCLGINEHLIIGWQVLSCSADLKILLWSYARSSPLVGRKALQHCFIVWRARVITVIPFYIIFLQFYEGKLSPYFINV